MRLRVDRFGVGYAVFFGRKRLTSVYGSRNMALLAMCRMEEKARQDTSARARACLTCGAGFWSTGHGHRMCDNCRARISGVDAQMVG